MVTRLPLACIFQPTLEITRPLYVDYYRPRKKNSMKSDIYIHTTAGTYSSQLPDISLEHMHSGGTWVVKIFRPNQQPF